MNRAAVATTPRQDAWRPKHPGTGRLIPARVEVTGVDGLYTDAESLREVAAMLLKLAARLEYEGGQR